MSMRADFQVRILPDSYVTYEEVCGMEEIENGRKNRWGEKPQRMVRKSVEVRGGVLIVVPGKPGHSIRLQSLDQALDLKLIDEDTYWRMKDDKGGLQKLRPRLIDTGTGEEVNENGIPLALAYELEHGTMQPKNAGRRSQGNVETDVDVNTTGDEDIAGTDMPDDGIMAGREHVDATIDETE